VRACEKIVLQFACSYSVLTSMVMESAPRPPEAKKTAPVFYCPVCAVEASDPLTCGDCSAVICRRCGTPLESSDELGMG
jgi:hypothetical protein